MLEVALPSEHHNQVMLVGSIDNFLVLHRATRLNNSNDAGLSSGFNAVREREERVRALNSFEKLILAARVKGKGWDETYQNGVLSAFASTFRCQPDRVNAVGLTGADTNGRSALD